MPGCLIIDYGMGNIASVEMALDYLDVPYSVSSSPDEIAKAAAYILPGVGAFQAAMENLRSKGLIAPLKHEVMDNKKPFLGICLGMQLLAESSTEKGYAKGLGWIPGKVVEIPSNNSLRVPHVGWNNVSEKGNTILFDKITSEKNFYFDHSFRMVCPDEFKIATCENGTKIVAAVRKDNIFATQFHPEKSQRNGLKLLRNFTNYAKSITGAR